MTTEKRGQHEVFGRIVTSLLGNRKLSEVFTELATPRYLNISDPRSSPALQDNGTLAGSYWRTQCVKRDDSIRFLSLKLQAGGFEHVLLFHDINIYSIEIYN